MNFTRRRVFSSANANEARNISLRAALLHTSHRIGYHTTGLRSAKYIQLQRPHIIRARHTGTNKTLSPRFPGQRLSNLSLPYYRRCVHTSSGKPRSNPPHHNLPVKSPANLAMDRNEDYEQPSSHRPETSTQRGPSARTRSSQLDRPNPTNRHFTRRDVADPGPYDDAGDRTYPRFPPVPWNRTSRPNDPQTRRNAQQTSRPRSPPRNGPPPTVNAPYTPRASGQVNGTSSDRGPPPHDNSYHGPPRQHNYRPATHRPATHDYGYKNGQGSWPSSSHTQSGNGSGGPSRWRPNDFRQATPSGPSTMDQTNASLNSKFAAMQLGANGTPQQPQQSQYSNRFIETTNSRSSSMRGLTSERHNSVDFIRPPYRPKEPPQPPLQLTPEEAHRRMEASLSSLRKETVRRIDLVIKRTYGSEYRVELFGSTFYGVSSEKSDLDLVIVDSKRMTGFPPSTELYLPRIYNINLLRKTLTQNGFKQVRGVPKASVPIVKFIDGANGFECDINVNDQLGLVNSMMLKNYCDMSTVLRPMLRLIKAWAKPLGLNNPSGGGPRTFSSYALSLMTIGFLQSRGLLPNLQADLPPLDPNVDDERGTFWVRRRNLRMKCDTRWTPYHDTYPIGGDVQTLMREWFEHWACEFKYQETMICIRRGGVVHRPIVGPTLLKPSKVRGKETDGGDQQELEAAVDEDAEPPSEASEVEGDTNESVDDVNEAGEIANNTIRADEWEKCWFVVADPFVRRQNVVAGVAWNSLRRFRTECQRAVTLINEGKTVEQMIEELEPVVIVAGKKKKKKNLKKKGDNSKAKEEGKQTGPKSET